MIECCNCKYVGILWCADDGGMGMVACCCRPAAHGEGQQTKDPTAPESGDLSSAAPAPGEKGEHDSAVGAQHAHSAHDGDVMNSSEVKYLMWH